LSNAGIETLDDEKNEMVTIPWRISVVVCAHNEERTIEACLKSIFMQTLKPYEVIVVLDRCTDNTRLIISSINQHIKIIEKNSSLWKNSYTENLELARKLINGNVYAIIDADVCLSSDYFQKTTDLFQSEEILLVSGKIVFCSENPNFISRFARSWQELFWASPSWANLVFGCALLVKTQFLNRIGGFEDVGSPDTYLYQQASRRKLKHVFVRDTIAFHLDEDLPLSEVIDRQIIMGQRRRESHLSFLRTVVFAFLRLKPFTISGWLSDSCMEEKRTLKK
jgi:cellulose synthase/poly-beta-1,6-N-acetylglucosamine synthase-like glycosyltransferase